MIARQLSGNLSHLFPISVRPELCCYRNTDSTKLNNADFLHPTWHKKLTLNSFWEFNSLSAVNAFIPEIFWAGCVACTVALEEVTWFRLSYFLYQTSAFIGVFSAGPTGLADCLAKAIMSLTHRVILQYSHMVLSAISSGLTTPMTILHYNQLPLSL